MKKKTKLEKFLTFHLEYLTGSKFSNCPFCGYKPREVLTLDEGTKVCCINKDCGIFEHIMPLELWEKRVNDHSPICDICGRQADVDSDEIGGCNKCSLVACKDCISEEGWCLECVYDFGKGGK